MMTFTYNGVNSAAYNLFISGEGTFDAPAPVIDEIEIPGRNGTLIIPEGRFNNISVTYPGIIRGNFAANAQSIRNWLLSVQNYARLTDDYGTGEYRMALFAGKLTFDPTAANLNGIVKITFNCKPQRFLTSGESATTISTSGSTITNPTAFASQPLIQVNGTANGTGTLTVNGTTITISNITNQMMIDCDTMNAYKGTTNLNGDISASVFPVLGAGANTVSWTGNISSVKITPRWWRV